MERLRMESLRKGFLGKLESLRKERLRKTFGPNRNHSERKDSEREDTERLLAPAGITQ
jgi:hypothetical protein